MQSDGRNDVRDPKVNGRITVFNINPQKLKIYVNNNDKTYKYLIENTQHIHYKQQAGRAVRKIIAAYFESQKKAQNSNLI